MGKHHQQTCEVFQPDQTDQASNSRRGAKHTCLCRKDAALWVCHVSPQVIQDTSCSPGKVLILGQGKSIQVGASQLRVVIQHLFKVRNVPEVIYAISVEASSDLIIHASCCHLLQGELYNFQDLTCMHHTRSTAVDDLSHDMHLRSWWGSRMQLLRRRLLACSLSRRAACCKQKSSSQVIELA